jgi:hypothetical protein
MTDLGCMCALTIPAQHAEKTVPLDRRLKRNMQTLQNHVKPAELVGALDALDVPFIVGGMLDAHLSPSELIQGLAGSSEARLRSAIIPLLLRHPEFAPDALTAHQALTDLARITCECFYTAAVLLQRKYRVRLTNVFGAQTLLPDWMSADLHITLSTDVEVSFQALGERHAVLTGLTINWVGTYHHAAERFIRHCEIERRWNRPTVLDTI